jgi:ABC-type molybdate transport system substrate-binding protein
MQSSTLAMKPQKNLTENLIYKIYATLFLKNRICLYLHQSTQHKNEIQKNSSKTER